MTSVQFQWITPVLNPRCWSKPIWMRGTRKQPRRVDSGGSKKRLGREISHAEQYSLPKMKKSHFIRHLEFHMLHSGCFSHLVDTKKLEVPDFYSQQTFPIFPKQTSLLTLRTFLYISTLICILLKRSFLKRLRYWSPL